MARWQSLRILQRLYTHPEINSRYIASPCITGEADPHNVKMIDILELASSKRISPTMALSAPEAARFYKSLIRNWVAVETHKLARQCRYPLQSIANKTWDTVTQVWQQRKDLQEGLDVLEVFDFVYGFLCLHIDGVDVASFEDWAEEPFLSPNEPPSSMRGFFIKNLWLTLNPADVLELLFFTSFWRQQKGSPTQTWSRAEKRNYLRMRGFF